MSRNIQTPEASINLLCHILQINIHTHKKISDLPNAARQRHKATIICRISSIQMYIFHQEFYAFEAEIYLLEVL